jgi:hypothetical protein
LDEDKAGPEYVVNLVDLPRTRSNDQFLLVGGDMALFLAGLLFKDNR